MWWYDTSELQRYPPTRLTTDSSGLRLTKLSTMILKNIIYLSALRKILTCMPPYLILKFIINREISTYHRKESPSQLSKLVPLCVHKPLQRFYWILKSLFRWGHFTFRCAWILFSNNYDIENKEFKCHVAYFKINS